MKIKRFTVPLYGYKVVFIRLPAKWDVETAARLGRILKSAGCDDDLIKTQLEEYKNGDVNGGVHFYNFKKALSIVVINYCTSPDKEIEVIAHEKRHLEDRIMEWATVKDAESAGLLAGWLAKKMK